MHINIFYSWQSDLPNKFNRGFIQECLEKAIKQIEGNKIFNIDIRLDKDTQGVEGSPDIVDTIFDKIKSSHIFVADISIVNQDNDDKRKMPNPNVLIELGYAAACLGWDRILILYNWGYGQTEDLPFDLKVRRPIFYSLNGYNQDEKPIQKKHLIAQLAWGLYEISSKIRFYENEIVTKLYPFYHTKITEIYTECEDLLLNLYKYSGCEHPYEDDNVFPPNPININQMIKELNMFLGKDREWENSKNKSYRDYDSEEIVGYFEKSIKKINKKIKKILKFREGLNKETLILIAKLSLILDSKKYYGEYGSIFLDDEDKHIYLFKINLISDKVIELMMTVNELKMTFVDSHLLHKEEFYKQQSEKYDLYYGQNNMNKIGLK